MRINHIILISIVTFFIACQSNEKKSLTEEDEFSEYYKTNKEVIYEKPKPTADVIEYEINDDYITDEQYPHRIENEKICTMVFHYTAQSYKKSLRALTTGGNSSHWLVPANGQTVYKIVSEDRRAQHAGESLWKNRKNVNVISIGIEIVNLGFKCKNNRKFCNHEDIEWIDFPEAQQKLIVSLAKDIQERYQIDPLCVVGHSDIAIDRKLDPGPLFPWKKMAENGIGAWATDEEIKTQTEMIKKTIGENISPLLLQIRLYEFGYDIRKENISNKKVQNKLISHEYNIHKTPIADLKSLNIANEYGLNNAISDVFDNKKTNFALHSFLMHYLPDDYLAHRMEEEAQEAKKLERAKLREKEKKKKEKQTNKLTLKVHRSKHGNKKTPDKMPDFDGDTIQLTKGYDKLKILATLQALLVKYPNKVRIGCNF